jgi:hypothetical protein
MANDHQRFTGINIDGPGTWRSMCGTDGADIEKIFSDVVGHLPMPNEIGEAKWLMGGCVFYGIPIKCRSLEEYRTWLQNKYVGGPEPLPPEPEPDANGLRHDWHKARGTWLYPGDRSLWLASHRMMTWNNDKIDEYLRQPEIKIHSDHVVICCSTGTRNGLLERPFNALKDPDRVREVFQRVIAADKAPVAWLMSQEFFIQELERNHAKLLDQLEHTAELIHDLCNFAVPFRELGDIYSGRFMKERNQMFRAMRKGAPDLPLAEHERGLVEIPVDDFAGVGGDVISLLQTSFKTPTGGKGRPEDQVTSPGGSHTYDGAAEFIQRNGDRMTKWQLAGRLERHTNAVGEHSIPFVYAGQPWKPYRDLPDAQERGKVLLQHGASFDLSSGAKL